MKDGCLKALCTALALMLAFSCIKVNALDENSSTDEPIYIHTISELRAIEKDLSGSYKLANNIIADDNEIFYALGSKSEMFTGTFDGNGYFIEGLKLSANVEEGQKSAYVGLFAYNAGEIKNLTLTKLSISLPPLSWLYIGGIAATNTTLAGRENGGLITNCFVEGEMNVDAGDIWVRVGGITGSVERGEISRCVSNVNISYNGKTSIDAGGITSCNGGSIRYCSNRGEISVVTSRDAQIGGITALAKGQQDNPSVIDSCVNKGNIKVESDMTLTVGGIIGRMYIGGNYTLVSNTVSAGKITKKANFSSGFNPSMALLAFGAVAGDFQGSGSDNYYINGVFEKPVGNGKLETHLATPEEIAEQFKDNENFYLPTYENAVLDIAAYKVMLNWTTDSFYEGYADISKPSEIHALYDDGSTAPIKPCISLSSVPYSVYYGGKTLYGYVSGDVDYNGQRTVTDIIKMRGLILEPITAPTADDLTSIVPADYNNDGAVSVTDITALLDEILAQN